MIIPLAPGETEWKTLVKQLKSLSVRHEIILATGNPKPEFAAAGARVVQGRYGRAQLMNAAAREAKGNMLWFLHADSKPGKGALEAAGKLASHTSRTLHYNDLKFRKDGPALMKLNAWAVRFRSDVLKMPFGDQGFLISKNLFEELGGYREDVVYGEDHLLVWKARQEGVAISRTGGSVSTSARKYRKGGWLKTTWKHVCLTVKQGVPQMLILLQKKFR